MAATITAVPSRPGVQYVGRLRPPMQAQGMPGRQPLPARPVTLRPPMKMASPSISARPAPRPQPRQAPRTQQSGPRATILAVDHIKRAIGDDNFYTMLPEFLPVKRKIEAMHVDYARGCNDCRKRRIATSLTSDFVSVLTNLSDDGLARVKKYLGVPRLMVRSRNTQTGKLELKEI